MNDELITIIAFVVVVFGIGWYFWPKQKIEESKLDPVPESAPVAEIKPAPVASLEPIVAPEPVVETPAPAPEPVVEAPVAAPKAKKSAAKKEKTFIPAAAPKPKVPAKKVTKK